MIKLHLPGLIESSPVEDDGCEVEAEAQNWSSMSRKEIKEDASN